MCGVYQKSGSRSPINLVHTQKLVCSVFPPLFSWLTPTYLIGLSLLLLFQKYYLSLPLIIQ